MKKRITFLISTLLFLSICYSNDSEIRYTDNWGKQGFTIDSQTNLEIVVNFSVESFTLSNFSYKDELMQHIEFAGNILPNNEGAPDLPSMGSYIAIPQGSVATINILSSRTEVIQNVNISPAHRIPKETEKEPLEFIKDESIYSVNKFYPEQAVMVSGSQNVRGVDMVILGVTPFRYNAVTKELVVYKDLKIEITLDGGNGQFGENRLRSRWWDPLLADMLLNFEVLPKMNYNKSYQGKDETGCEYLIITPNGEEFQQWADSIKSFRTLQGILTDIVTLEEIGGNNVGIIEDYINDAYLNWDIAPAACLLLGDYGVDAENSILSPLWDSYCVSDNIYADVSGNSMPDIIFARMTAQNDWDLETMITKVLDYERNPPTSVNFYQNPITALGFQTERWFQICSEVVAGYLENVQGKSTIRVNAVYEGDPLTDPWSTAGNTYTLVNYFGPNGLGYIPETPAEVASDWLGTANQIKNAINDGAYMTFHRDHGYETGWGEPDFGSGHINVLSNTDLTFVWSVNCLTGKYNLATDCFSETFHKKRFAGNNAGALGILAASEVSYSFVNDVFIWGAFDNMWPDFLPEFGTTPESRNVMPAFANAAGKYFLEQSNWPFNPQHKEVTYNLFHHHGDAFTTVYTEVPLDLTVQHETTLYAGVNNFVVTTNEGALIALTVNGEIIGTAEGIGTPVSIEIPAQLPPDEVLITVTLQNYYRYESVVEVVSASGPYVTRESWLINDISGGNGNGLMDYGETNLLSLSVENVGVQQAENVDVFLNSIDQFIYISDFSENYGTIEPGEIINIVDAFEYEVANDIPDGHMVSFEVEATIGSDTWFSYFSIEAQSPSLQFVEYLVLDEMGNNNGIIDPGETVDISVEIINNGSSDAFSVFGELSTTNPLITINSGFVEYGDLSAGTDGIALFSVTASETIVPGSNASFILQLSGDKDIAATDGFSLVIGQNQVLLLSLDGNGTSVNSMEVALSELNIVYETINYFPDELDDFNILFICLGVMGEKHILTQDEGEILAEFIEDGGNVYMEGGDTWYYDSPTTAHELFNIIGVSDGSSDLETIIGFDGTFAEGMSFNYIGDNIWMDHIMNIPPAVKIFENEIPNYCTGVAFDEGSYNTIGTSHEFGGLNDGLSPSTKLELMRAYLSFFDVDMDIHAAFGSGDTEACINDPVIFVDISTGPVNSWYWTFEGGVPENSSEQFPEVEYPEEGAFDVKLVVSDGYSQDSLLIEEYITVGGAPEIPGTPTGDDEVYTNLVQTSEYITTGSAFADSYEWYMLPVQAGTIDGDGTIATVDWTQNWEGTAKIMVRGVNQYCESEYSDEFEVDCSVFTGINGVSESEDLLIYPNPSNGVLHLELKKNSGKLNITFSDVLNDVVYHNDFEENESHLITIDLDHLPTGIYFVNIESSSLRAIKKVILK